MLLFQLLIFQEKRCLLRAIIKKLCPLLFDQIFRHQEAGCKIVCFFLLFWLILSKNAIAITANSAVLQWVT